jgi:hypothetical protein
MPFLFVCTAIPVAYASRVLASASLAIASFSFELAFPRSQLHRSVECRNLFCLFGRAAHEKQYRNQPPG